MKKISELMIDLAGLIEKHGDLEVRLSDYDRFLSFPISQAKVVSKDEMFNDSAYAEPVPDTYITFE